MDTDCVFYNYNQPNKFSDFECLGIPSDTSLTDILKAIDARMCTPILVQDTYTLDLGFNGAGALFGNVRIDPASTLPYSIGPNGIKLDCCENPFACEDVEYEIEFSLGEVVKSPDVYTTLDPTYFTKSQYLDNVELIDNTSFVGGTFSYLKYTNFLTSSMVYVPGNGQTVSMPLQSCAKSIIGKTAQFVGELGLAPICRFYKPCTISAVRVPHSEKLKDPGNFNAQFDEPPYYNGWLYFPDIKDGAVIRKANLDTREVITISGTKTALTDTLNGANGAYAAYPGLGSIITDLQEISNGEPVIYTITPKGALCRIVRVSSDKCDERENWTTFVIAGDNIGGDVTGIGSVARFRTPLGVKRMGYYNGAPILLIADTANGKVKMAYYTGINKNSSANWIIANLPVDVDPVAGSSNKIGFANSMYANINVDAALKQIVTFYEYGGKSIICMTNFTGNVNVPADYLSTSNYACHYALNATTATGQSLTLSSGSVAPVKDMYFVSKIYKSGPIQLYSYAYGEYDGVGLKTNAYLNSFYLNTTSGTLTPTNYRFAQLIANNTSQAIGGTGSMPSGVNSTCYGIVYVPIGNVLKHVDLTKSAFRIIDFGTNIVGPVLVGEINGTYTNGDISASDYMDTQYELQTQC